MRIPFWARVLGAVSTLGLAACSTVPQPGGVFPGDLRPSADARAQLFESGRRVMADLPAAIPAPQAETQLQMPPDPQVARQFTPDTWNGQTGLYQGYAPGLTADVMARSRFYPRGDWMFPYYNQSGQYHPVSYLHQGTGMNLYPAYLAHQGTQYPVYCADSTSLVPGAFSWPTASPLGYQSPLALPTIGAGIPPIATTPVGAPQLAPPHFAGQPPFAPPAPTQPVLTQPVLTPPIALPPQPPCCLPPPPPPCCLHTARTPVFGAPYSDTIEIDYGPKFRHKSKWRKRHHRRHDD